MKKLTNVCLAILTITLFTVGLASANLNQPLIDELTLNAPNAPGMFGAVIRVGPDFASGTDEYLIGVTETATDGTITVPDPLPSTTVSDWNALFNTLTGQGYNVELYVVVTPTATVVVEESPIFFSEVTGDNPWVASTYWTDMLAEGQYAVQANRKNHRLEMETAQIRRGEYGSPVHIYKH